MIFSSTLLAEKEEAEEEGNDTMIEGKERLMQRERSSCKDEGVGSSKQVSLPLTY